MFYRESEKTRIKEEVNAFFFRDPALNSAMLIGKIQDRNAQLKLQIANDYALSKKFENIVRDKLTKTKSFLKTKIFADDTSKARYDGTLEIFTSYLFGGRSYLDEELRASAACIRYFRDVECFKDKIDSDAENGTTWRDLNEAQFAECTKDFFEKLSNFLKEIRNGGRDAIASIVNNDLETY
jgi:hypothetical protein